MLDDSLPAEHYSTLESAVVRYAVKSIRMEPIDGALYAELSTYFEPQQMVDLCLTVGVSNMVNRFHATFFTDVDERTLREVEAGNVEAGVDPIPMPERPT